MSSEKRYLILVLLISLFLNGCFTNTTEEDIDSNILFSDDCKPPCWNQIVPGETNLSDALAILESMERQGLGKSIIYDEDMVWRNTKGENYAIGISSELVVSIRFQVFNLPLEELITLFGQPEYYLISEITHGGNIGVLLIYPDLGIVLTTGGEPNISSIYKFEPHILISYARYYGAFDIEYLMNVPYNLISEKEKDQISEWEGYEIYYP